MFRYKVLACLLLAFSVCIDGYSQDDRTFWQKLFGKKKSEQVNTETPQNSQDSLAVLLQDHLNPNAVDSIPSDNGTPQNDGTTELIKDVPNGNVTGVSINVSEDLTTFIDTVSQTNPVGYRIQVFLGDLSQARRIRSTLLNQGHRATLDYNMSDYYVRIGDYRSYMEAQKALKGIKNNYSKAYIIKDIIEL